MIWVSPNTGYPMSLWFISVSINTGPQWQRGDNDPRSPGCAQFFLLAFFGVGLSGLAYCILLLHNLATIFEHVGILVVWNMYFFHSVGNSNPNWRTPSFFRRVGSTTNQVGILMNWSAVVFRQGHQSPSIRLLDPKSGQDGVRRSWLPRPLQQESGIRWWVLHDPVVLCCFDMINVNVI